MREYICKSFNAKLLLAQGDLDMRAVAAREPGLTAEDYFGRLKRLTYSTPSCDTDGLLESVGFTPSGRDSVVRLIERVNSSAIRRKFAKEPEKDNASVTLKEALEFWDYEESNRKLRILAVDDITVVLHTVTSILSPYYEVFALKDGTQLLSTLESLTPELFLLDIEMEGMNGFELITLIRSLPAHRETPVIFLTGNASYDNLKEAVKLGACDFMAKPIDKDVLLEKIGKSIVRKRAF